MIPILFISSVVSVAIPLLLARRYGSVPLVSPLHILGYLVFFGMFLKTIYLGVFDGEMFFQLYIDDPWAVIEGYLFVTGFVLMICLGYVVSIRKVWRMRDDALVAGVVSQVRYPRVLMLVGVATALAVIGSMMAARGLGGVATAFDTETLETMSSSRVVRIEGVEGFGATGAISRALLFIPTLALMVFITRHTLLRRDLLIMLALLAQEFFLTILEGKRFELVNILALFVFVSVMLGRRFSPASIFKAAGGVALVLALFVTMTNLRNTHSQAQTASAAETLTNQIFGSTYFLDVNVPILIIALSRPDDRFWGESYTYWTFAWVPRALWPDKPVVTLGPYVKQEVLGIRNTVGGVNPTGPGEAFLNFGWLGMLVGFGLGALYRAIEYLTLSPGGLRRRYGFWMYPIVAYPFITATMQSSFAAALTTSLFKALLMILVLKLFSLRFRLGPATDRVTRPTPANRPA